MDLQKVLKRLQTRGIIRKRTSHRNHKELIPRGRYVGNLINLDHADIIRYYNSVIRGLFNYFDFVDNRKDVLYAIWLIKESCALTLAMKFKVRNLGRIFQKFGTNLTCNIDDGETKKSISLLETKDLVRKRLEQSKVPNPINNLERS